MLTRLRISNFALLEGVELEFENALTFLTGETGAGKSIIIDAVLRLLGSRAAQDDVRAGQSKAVLEAEFDRISSVALSLLSEWQIDPEEDSRMILRREIQSTGRSRMLINNCSVTLQQLRALAPLLVDLFGQNEHQTLLDEESQRLLYDRTIGIASRVKDLAAVAEQIATLQREWRDLHERERQRQRNIDMLQFQITEIENVRPTELEEADLQKKRVLMQNSAKIHSGCESLLQTLVEKDGSLVSQLKEVEKSIEELAKYNEDLAPIVSRIPEWQETISDLIHRIHALSGGLDFEEGALDGVEARLEAYQTLKKKYGPTIGEVLSHLEKCKQELEQDLGAEERGEQIVKEIQGKAEKYNTLAAGISDARKGQAAVFAKQVEAELQQIALEKCRFRVVLEKAAESGTSPADAEFPPYGRESVRFEIEPNPGEGFRELNKIASGGELSRFMLALKIVGQTEEDRVLIFDEIDAGIGGRVAYQVGERLKRLSRRAQVLCVTHLPQVAAFGDHHFRVKKVVFEGRTTTIVENLDEKRRIEELARMISGSEVTETALQHARELREQVEAT